MKKAIIAFGVLIFSLAMFLLLRENKIFEIELDGFAYPGDEIKTTLLNNGEPVTYDAVTGKEFDEVFAARNEFYLDNGENRSRISISLPYISQDGTRLVLLDDTNNIIDKKFNTSTSFRGLTVVNNKIYNFSTNDEIDQEEYIFLGTNDNFFINLSDLSIYTSSGNKNIPSGSLIYFEKNYLRYYSLNLNTAKFIYSEINGIDANDKTSILDDTLTYKQLLEKLKIWHYDDHSNPPSDDEYINESIAQIEEYNNGYHASDTKAKEDDTIFVEKEGDKLEVRAKYRSSQTYSAVFDVYIHDPNDEIVRFPTIEIYKGGNIYSRKTTYQTGDEEIIALLPDTTYTYQIYYIYRNEDDKQIRVVLDNGEFNTLSIENIEPIKINYTNVTTSTNSATITNLRLENNIDDEVLKGLQKAVAIVNDQEIKFGTVFISRLRELEPQTWSTPNVLKSDTFYHLEIKMYDNAGNELKVENSMIDLKTTKQPPAAKITLKNSDFTWFLAETAITNPDNVNISNLRYALLEGDKIIRQSTLSPNADIYEKDLTDGSIYQLIIYADYDLEDGLGLRKKSNT